MIDLGYLTPEGELLKCWCSWGHLVLAQKICNDLNVKCPTRVDCEQYLLSIGYIGIRAHDIMYDIRIKVTDEQKKWLIDNYKDCSDCQRESIDELLDRGF